MNASSDFSKIDESQLNLPSLDPSSPVPLYHQLYKELSEQIKAGALPVGSKVPSELKIARQLDVSRITVKRALNELAKVGLVSRKRGRGTVVMCNTDLNFNGGANDYRKNVAGLRTNTDAEILERKTVKAKERVAGNLKIDPGSEVEKITHRLSLDGKALSYVEVYVPNGLAKNFTEKQLRAEPLMNLLIKAGVSIKRAEQKIFAVGANEHESEVLSVPSGSPLLKIHCVMLDQNDRPVEDIYAWYHPDRYQYQMTLTNIDEPQSY